MCRIKANNFIKILIAACSGCLFIGIFLFLTRREILVVHWSGLRRSSVVTNKKHDAISRRNITLWYWLHEALAREPMTIIWHEHDAQENLKIIAQRWLQFVQDEDLVSSALTLQTVAISLFNQQGILSFSGPIVKKEYSIYKKWYLIESLCKTIRESGIALQNLQMLENQKPMKDDHLDFLQPWSIHGYLTE